MKCVTFFVVLLSFFVVYCHGTKDNLDSLPQCNVTEKCRPCTAIESATIHPLVCDETGYIEVSTCNSGPSYHSCLKDRKLEATTFWKFEISMICVSLVFGIVVMLRMKKLDQLNMDRIQKQLSAL